MPFTPEILVEAFNAVNDQMQRCPACFGIGRVRQGVNNQSCFCLVCENIAKTMSSLNHSWVGDYTPSITSDKVYDQYKATFDGILIAGREFAKRCPGCYGVRKVWRDNQIRPCLVCRQLHTALDAYEYSVTPTTEAVPVVIQESKTEAIRR